MGAVAVFNASVILVTVKSTLRRRRTRRSLTFGATSSASQSVQNPALMRPAMTSPKPGQTSSFSHRHLVCTVDERTKLHGRAVSRGGSNQVWEMRVDTRSEEHTSELQSR